MDQLTTEQETKLLEIALVNHLPANGQRYDWTAFDPRNVKGLGDLPPFFFFGPLDKSQTTIADDCWRAVWTSEKTKGSLTVSWSRDTDQYSVSQVWHGIDGGSAVSSADRPLSDAITALYENGFPAVWKEEAKAFFEGRYQLCWNNRKDDEASSEGIQASVVCGFPDGVFRTIHFPVNVADIRGIKHLLESIGKTSDFGFFAYTHLGALHVYYKEPLLIPEWVRDEKKASLQTLADTGYPESFAPVETTLDGKPCVYLAKLTPVVTIDVPFAYVEYLLDQLSKAPTPFRLTTDAALRGELRPLVTDATIPPETKFGIPVDTQGMTVILIVNRLTETLASLLMEDSEQKISELETYSKENLKELRQTIINGAEKNPRVVQ